LSDILQPFSVAIDFGTGNISPPPAVLERRLTDMAGYYVQDAEGDALAYSVHEVRVPTTSNNLLSSTTILQPGKVGDEYYMTKGHFHENRDRAEIYLGLSGKGVIVMALENGDTRTAEIQSGVATYIPGYWAHRTVNTGTEPLVFYAVYIGDAGYDYATIKEAGFPVIVVDNGSGPEVVANPRYRRQ
jgi:glucose-6-phosphate isomerase, archaeal